METLCFQPERRCSPRSLRRSLGHSEHDDPGAPHQSVWVIDAFPPRPGAPPAGPLAAYLVLWHFKRRVRIYNVATHPALRGHGLGSRLVEHGERIARKAGAAWMSLEAGASEPGLVPWYEHRGYVVVERLRGFYGRGHDAVRMRKPLR